MEQTFKLAALSFLAILATSQPILGQQSQTVLPLTARRSTVSNQPVGISVHGNGVAAFAADVAQVTLGLSSRNKKPTITLHSLRPIVDALIRAHADPKSIGMPIFLYNPGTTAYANVSATFEHPTLPTMVDAVKSISQTVAGMPDILVGWASVIVTSNKCDDLRYKALRHALETAHTQAVEIARAGGFSVGKMLWVRATSGDTSAMSGATVASCSSRYQLSPGNYPAFGKLSDYLRVQVFANVDVTYAIVNKDAPAKSN